MKQEGNWEGDIESVLAHAPIGIFVVDRFNVIKRINQVALDYLETEHHFILNQSFGNGIGCVNSFEDERGCGFSSQCKKCNLRKAVNLAITQSISTENMEEQRDLVQNQQIVQKWYKVSVTPLKLKEEKVVVIYIIDMTESKKTEEKIRRAKMAAEQASKAKSEFLANMSHEIRTPLNGMMGMIDLTLLTGLTAEQRENLETAKFCANSLLNVINDILDFSKMEAGKLEIDEADFHIKLLMDEVIKIHTTRTEAKKLNLNYSFSSAIPEYVKGDPNRLMQVLNNLIGNAIKFTDRGEINIKVELAQRKDKDLTLTFSIEDTGIGISEEGMSKLFQSFSQVDGSFTRKAGGTGLGLIISKQLVEMMGGTIGVESVVGKGSTFSFTLSFYNGNNRKNRLPAAIKNENTMQKSLNILVAEDDRVNQIVLTKLLKEHGHSVEIATNGLEAVEKFIRGNFDLILMDIQMPEMDGKEAAKRIRMIENGRNQTPIIAVTAYVTHGDQEWFLNSSMNDYVTKPVDSRVLLASIQRVMSVKGISYSEVNNGEPERIQKELDFAQRVDSNTLHLLLHDMEEFKGALEKNRFEELERLVNNIKDLSQTLGLSPLKFAAFKAVLALRKGDMEAAVENSNRILEEFENVELKMSGKGVTRIENFNC